MKKNHISAFIIAASLWLPMLASADPIEIYSISPRVAAMGGAGTAMANDGFACYFNPALLSTAYEPAFSMGIEGATNFFKITSRTSSRDADLPHFGAGYFAFAYPLPFRNFLKRRIAIGAYALFPSDNLLKVTKQDSDEIIFPFYNDRVHRLSAAAAMSIKPFDFLALGGGVLVLANADADVSMNLSLEKEDIYNAAEIDAGYNFAPIVGALVKPFQELSIGLSWRGAQRVDINIPVNVEDPSAHARLYIPAFDTPHEFSIGASSNILRDFNMTLDTTYFLYSDYLSAFPHIGYLSADESKVLNESKPADEGYKNTFTFRGGVEYEGLHPITLRAGAAWRETPIPAQTQSENIIDGDAFTASTGVGLFVKGNHSIFPADFQFDFSVAGIVMREVYAEKTVFIAGTPSVGGKGEAYVFHLSMTVFFK